MDKILKVLIACEFSGVVREAFRNKGHIAYSCDLLPSLDGSPYHIQGDVLGVLDQQWDLMIAHPPCTFISSSGIGWFNVERYGEKAVERARQRDLAVEFFLKLYNAPIPRKCIENPVGYMNTHFRKPDQIINPFQFGHPERKRTCLWLVNLPKLVPTNIVEPEAPAFIDKTTGKKRYFVDKQTPKKDRWKTRSITFKGVAEAFASQWSL